MRVLTTAAFLAAAPFAAHSSVVDFASSPTTLFGQGALVFTDPTTGITLTVTAGTHDGGIGADVPFANETDCGSCVEQHGNGISVDQGPGDTHELDDNEFLRLTFSETVLLDSVWLNAGGLADEWDMAVDSTDLDINGIFGNDLIRRLPVDNLISSGLTDRVADFSTNGGSLEGTMFTFYTDDFNDDYKIGGIGFTAIAAVPLPAGLSLMLGGLAMMGGLRARRRAS